MHFTTFLAAACASLFIPSIIASPITSPFTPADLARRGHLLARDQSKPDLYLKDDDDHMVEAELERVFGVIEEIPDEVLEQGDEATDKWLVEHGYRATPDKRDLSGQDLEDRDLADRGFWDVTKCVGAIAAFIASNLIGAAKILRIKKYIEALGGLRRSAELLLKASTPAERLREGGEILALLAGEILGTSMVSNNC